MKKDMEDPEQTSDKEQIEKKSFKAIKFGVNQIVNIAIPHHLKRLDSHCANIEKYQCEGNLALLQEEQVNASNVVRSLKSNIRELEELNFELRDEDQEEFLDIIKSPIHDVTEKLAGFLVLHSDVMTPIPFIETNTLEDIPKLTCNSEESSIGKEGKKNQIHALQQLQLYDELSSPQLKHWGKLKNDIIELNKLFKSLAISVFSQKPNVDTIEDNVQQATDNVLSGTKELRRAVILKAALFPFAGAALGSLLGPAGAIIGFHAFGSTLCAIGGSFTGFAIGRKIKHSRLASTELEMQAIEGSSNSTSDFEHNLQATSTDTLKPALDVENKKNM